MNIRKKLLTLRRSLYAVLVSLILICLPLIVNGAVSLAQEPELSPSLLVQNVATITLNRIKHQKQNTSSNAESITVIIEEELMPYVDYKFAAFKVLGHNLRKASPEELKDFVEAFRNNLISSYVTVLSGLNDHEIEVEPLTLIPTNGFAEVKSLVTSSNGPPAKISFKLRLEPKTKTWQVYDIQAEGISLITSKKSEMDPIIRKYGFKRAIDLLNN